MADQNKKEQQPQPTFPKSKGEQEMSRFVGDGTEMIVDGKRFDGNKWIPTNGSEKQD